MRRWRKRKRKGYKRMMRKRKMKRLRTIKVTWKKATGWPSKEASY